MFQLKSKGGSKKSIEEGILRPDPPTAQQIKQLQDMDVEVELEEMNSKEYPDTAWFVQATEAIEKAQRF